MALVPLATKGNYFHVYDFRVKPGRGDDFIELGHFELRGFATLQRLFELPPEEG
jgi:hypothetical protein